MVFAGMVHRDNLAKLADLMAEQILTPRFAEDDFTRNKQDAIDFVNIAAEYEINPRIWVFGRVDNLTGEHYSEVHELVFVGPKALSSGFPALGTALYGGMKLRF